MKRELFILSAVASVGCANYAPDGDNTDLTEGSAQTYDEAQLQVSEDLEILASLELFEVGAMVVTSEMMPGICYGPCDDDDDREEAYIEQAARLHGLVAAAADTEGIRTGDVDQSLDELHALEIVQVGDLMVAEPEMVGNCYGPCPDEIEAAEELTDERAERICELAELTRGL